MRYHLVNAGAVVLAPVVKAVVDVLLAPHPREARGALAPLAGLSIVFGHNSKDCDQHKVGHMDIHFVQFSSFGSRNDQRQNGVGYRLTG